MLSSSTQGHLHASPVGARLLAPLIYHCLERPSCGLSPLSVSRLIAAFRCQTISSRADHTGSSGKATHGGQFPHIFAWFGHASLSCCWEAAVTSRTSPRSLG